MKFYFGKNGLQKQVNIALCVYLSTMTTGYVMGWMAPVTHKLQDPKLSPLSRKITETELSLVGTIVIVAGIFGPYISGYLANVRGRKLCLLLGSSITVVGQILVATAKNLIMLYIGRILVGIGISMNEVISLVYLGEIASTNIRGVLLTLTAIFRSFGTLFVYSLGPYVQYSIVGYVGALLAVINFFGLLCIPETPLYYVLKDNEKRAKEVLNDLGRSDDFQTVLALKDDEQQSKGKDWTQLLTVKSNRKAMIITVTLNILQQSSGIIAIVFFATRIFELVGSSIRPDISTIIIGVTQMLSSFVTPVFVERNGRKILLLLSTAFSSLSLVVLGVYFYIDEVDHSLADNIKWLPLVTLIIFLVAYNFGFAIIPFTLMGELFTSNVRSTGSAVSITIGWVFSFVMTTAFGSLITTLGGDVTFWMCSGVCAVAFVFTLVYVPETRFKSFIEIQEILNKYAKIYLGQVLVGYSLGWTAPIIPKLQDPATSPLPYQITEMQRSFVGSILYLGGLSGPYLSGYLSNVKGRKPCMIIGGLVAFVAYIILGTARTLVMIYIGRFLSGFGVGIITVMAIVYLGEIASTHIRGIFLTGVGIFITGGSLLAFSVGPFVSYSVSAYIGACLSLGYTIKMFFVLETPIYYALKDKEHAVKKVLEDLGRMDDIEKVYLSKQEFEESNSLKDWKELFTLKGNKKALTISIILNISQQGSGLLSVTFFATTIFELAGSSVEPWIATIVIGCTQLFGGLLTPIFVERCGRRILLLISTALCCLSMLVLGVYFYLHHIDHWVVQKITWLPLASLIIFYISYDSGLGIIPNALSGEMFEPNVRSKGCAVAITLSWLTGFLVTTTFGTLVTVVGGHVGFWFFSAVCGMTFLYCLFFVPETKGKSLVEIQEMLSK
ncbi:facilitated trehalose transporter Tret1-like [Epargyreus clarus]|uniref:facilitated trehalose transporter Tret1-like n=1 Tax=Epargyreus clarus TaxID=520877 RepID=UPI003C2DCE32